MPAGRHVPSSTAMEPCAWTGPSLSKTEGRAQGTCMQLGWARQQHKWKSAGEGKSLTSGIASTCGSGAWQTPI